MKFRQTLGTALAVLLATSVSVVVTASPVPRAQPAPEEELPQEHFLNPPLVTHIYTADPSAHVFAGKLYVYPSHDIHSENTRDESGGHFAMRDYHVFSMDSVGAPVKDHGIALYIAQVPWARQQMWAPDAAERNGKYYLYFPAKDYGGIFRIGVAVSDNPAGPFIPQPKPMEGAYSIDPAVFENDGEYYLYVGGIWGGQLQRWQTGQYSKEDYYPDDNEPALTPLIAKLADDMVSLAEPLKPVVILDEKGNPLLASDNDRRFFEAAWVHKFGGRYYLSYSTGDTHKIQYAISDSPYGPFVYRGELLKPVLGWTNHHSVVEFEGKWWVFYHDSSLSGGKSHLRSMKMAEIRHLPDGSIETLDTYFADDH